MNLQLPLKKQWFDMTKSGDKLEDYREITPYWCSRLMLYNGSNYSQEMYKRLLDKWGKDFLKKLTESQLNQDTFKKFTTNTLTLGYPKSTDNERIIKFEHAGIEIRTGVQEWGAEPNKLYFVIKHGKKLY
jgi:hypothetical protein